MELKYKKTKIACYGGYTVQAIINNFLPILFIIFQKDYNFSYKKIGFLIFVNFFTQLFADVSTPFLVKKVGFKRSAVLCNALAATGLISLFALSGLMKNTYLAILISIIIYAFGSGIVEVVISPIMEYLPTDNKEGNMAILHSFYCWGQAFTIFVTTFLVKILGFGHWRFIPLIWAVIPLCNMIFFTTVPVIEPKEENKKSESNIFKSYKFYAFVVIMLCSGASEISISQWTSIFAQNGLHISKLAGDILGPCAFGIFMGTGRIIYAVFSDKIPYLTVSRICAVLTAVCYLTVGLSGNPVISLIACALCGVGVSTFWPATLSYAVKILPYGGTVLFSMMALSGDLGCSSGPWSMGLVADRWGLNMGFVFCALFPVLLFVASFFFGRKKD